VLEVALAITSNLQVLLASSFKVLLVELMKQVVVEAQAMTLNPQEPLVLLGLGEVSMI
jgi:hypothetical protein